MPRTAAVRAVLAAAALAALAPAARPEGGWWDSEPRHVPLEKLQADPVGWKDVPVILTLQFGQKYRSFNPFYTRFTPDQYLNFSAWSDGAELWDREQYRKVHPFFFVERNDGFARRLGETATRARFTCRAIVRDVFRGEPWIQVSEVRDEADAVGPEVVRAVLRGHQAFDKGDRDGAIAAYREALARHPGAGAEAAIHRHIARVLWSRQDLGKSKAEIVEALKLNPDDAGALDLQAAIEGAEKRLLAIPAPEGPALLPKEAPPPAVEPLNPPPGAKPAVRSPDPSGPQPEVQRPAPPKPEATPPPTEEPQPPPPPKKRPAPPR